MSHQPDVTPDAYARWLQAQRPPFDWFMELPEEGQQELAMQGVIHRWDAAQDAAMALLDPERFEVECYGDESEAEEIQVRRLAAKAVGHILGAEEPQAAPQRPGPEPVRTMAGVLDRREEADQARAKATGEQRSFLGRKPDAVKTVETVETVETVRTPVPEPDPREPLKIVEVPD